MRRIPPLALALCLAAASARADFINPGFETGDLTGWSSVGDVLVDDGTWGTAPSEGSFQLLLTTLPSPQGSSETFASLGPLSGVAAVSPATLTSALGLQPNRLQQASPSGNPVVQGSAAWQDVAFARNDTISFDWRLLTNAAVPTSADTDFAFFTLTPNGIPQGIDVLADTGSSAFFSSSSSFDWQTGLGNTTFVVRRTGTFRVGVGVADVLNDDYTTGLVVDRVRKNPEPGTFALLASGLLALSVGRRRARSA